KRYRPSQSVLREQVRTAPLNPAQDGFSIRQNQQDTVEHREAILHKCRCVHILQHVSACPTMSWKYIRWHAELPGSVQRRDNRASHEEQVRRVDHTPVEGCSLLPVLRSHEQNAYTLRYFPSLTEIFT